MLASAPGRPAGVADQLFPFAPSREATARCGGGGSSCSPGVRNRWHRQRKPAARTRRDEPRAARPPPAGVPGGDGPGAGTAHVPGPPRAAAAALAGPGEAGAERATARGRRFWDAGSAQPARPRRGSRWLLGKQRPWMRGGEWLLGLAGNLVREATCALGFGSWLCQQPGSCG